MRPGRLELKLLIGPPDCKGREEILTIHTRAMAESGRLVLSGGGGGGGGGGDSDGRGPWIGFVGDGHTATNSLGVRRFVREGWPALRAQWPSARLRIVGRVPTGHRAGRRERHGGKDAPCAADEPRCGWAAATPCAGAEAACGIDALGYVSDEALRSEARAWRLLLVPIFASTGANTKLLLGLQLGLPIVSTVAAAVPFGIVPPRGSAVEAAAAAAEVGEVEAEAAAAEEEAVGGSAQPVLMESAALGTTAQELASLASRLLSRPGEAAQLAEAGRRHFVRLAASEAPSDDVRSMLRWVRRRQKEEEEQQQQQRQQQQQVQQEQQPLLGAHHRPSSSSSSGSSSSSSSGSGSSATAAPSLGGLCGPPSASSRPPRRVVSRCGLEELWPGASRLDAVWEDLCRACSWSCRHSSGSGSGDAGGGSGGDGGGGGRSGGGENGGGENDSGAGAAFDADLWLDASCAAAPLEGTRATAAVHFAWEPAAVRELYHYRGSALRAVVASERAAAGLARPCAWAAAARAPLSHHPPLAPNGSDLTAGLEPCVTGHARGLTVRVDRLGSRAGWRAAWAAAFGTVLGVEASETAALVRRVAEPHRPALVRDLRQRALHRPRPQPATQ